MRSPAGGIRAGCDVIEIARLSSALERNGAAFAKQLFTEKEYSDAAGDMEMLARLFAVKEAAIKVLGTGLAEGISLLNLAVSSKISNQLPADGAEICMLHQVVMNNTTEIKTTQEYITAYSWRKAQHVYARAYLGMVENRLCDSY